MNEKVALITGITGQDGSYLAELLLSKGYQVHGVRRRTSTFNTSRIDHLFKDRHSKDSQLFLHYGDMTDFSSLCSVLEEVKPTEIYNLAAQSHVAVSFEVPEYTANCDALGTLRLLEAIRMLGMGNSTRLYQASTSELFGNSTNGMQGEMTNFRPRSPYGVAKLYAYWIVVNYREAYNMYCCNGILFNHESPRRGEIFVSRKITRALARIKLGLQHKLYIGNLNAERDWGHAKDYVEMMWAMLQMDEPKDLVVATGVKHSVREFINIAADMIGIKITWQGEGLEEKGFDQSNRCIVEVDAAYFRPAEVDCLQGDASEAKRLLNWEPKISFESLVREMVDEDLRSEAKSTRST